ncbi:hypothetical protein BC834DRAFT_869759 [Gloeopeniophorella convolvens]|nr:hypothetical protein BC834DRAFT_869759 [Gloeopeniophorella convolvens]
MSAGQAPEPSATACKAMFRCRARPPESCCSEYTGQCFPVHRFSFLVHSSWGFQGRLSSACCPLPCASPASILPLSPSSNFPLPLPQPTHCDPNRNITMLRIRTSAVFKRLVPGRRSEGFRRDTKDVTLLVLEGLKQSADPCPPLKGAVSGLLFLV